MFVVEVFMHFLGGGWLTVFLDEGDNFVDLLADRLFVTDRLDRCSLIIVVIFIYDRNR